MIIQQSILKIKNFSLFINNRLIFKNINLNINLNEIHILLGPNGSGKTSFSKILVGHPNYTKYTGSIEFLKNNLLTMSPENRSKNGIFLAFQYPPEIPGLSNFDFLRILYNNKLKFLGKKEKNISEFFDIVNKFCELLKLDNTFLKRNFNEYFSGGEKKKNEILQMLLLNPYLIILDEIDSGLDIDSIKTVFDIINSNTQNSSFLVITHNPNILNLLNISQIHILKNKTFFSTTNKKILNNIIENGYDSCF